MEIAPISTDSAMMVISRMLGVNTALQTEMMKQMADSQQQMAALLQEIGVGQNVDIHA